MKQNAHAAQANGLALLVQNLAALAKKFPTLEIHLVGHSAGSILLGHLLAPLAGASLRAETLTLYAPACTVEFAAENYVPAVNGGVLGKNKIHFDVMSDERELADTVGPYGKSLLYLVSRALETLHKMPLLGMESALDPAAQRPDQWNAAAEPALKSWRSFATGTVPVHVYGKQDEKIWTGSEWIPLAHGAFDNSVKVVTDTLQRIRGGAGLLTPVENLSGF
jgi:pimeloyl-ACP methyl ester carboxylesterase